jgi:hypothetical protein
VIAVSVNQALRSEGIHLDAARNAVASARQNQLGIFATRNGLRLLPFELRYPARTTNGPNPSRPDLTDGS